MWVYGSGFPKSLDISKAIEKSAGAERQVVGQYSVTRDLSGGSWSDLHGKPNTATMHNITTPATPAAHTWQGYGTALKPALEPIVLAQKPREGSFVDNVTAYGCGALNVDGCRVGEDVDTRAKHNVMGYHGNVRPFTSGTESGGRWPSNLLIDDSPEVVGLFPSTGPSKSSSNKDKSKSVGYESSHWVKRGASHEDNGGSAARFFYCAKASRPEREAGCANVPPMKRDTSREEGAVVGDNPRNRGAKPIHNSHPTVKPIALMRYLLRLITQPEHNLILDPFAGSGTTGIACALAGVPCVLIEKDPHHVEIIKARIKWAANIRQLLGREPELDLTPYQSKPEPKSKDQGSLF